MNYREYWQRELYQILNDIYWVSQNIQVKYVFDCIEYKKLDLLAKICTKSSKILQKWALDYGSYVWHASYWKYIEIKHYMLLWNDFFILFEISTCLKVI